MTSPTDTSSAKSSIPVTPSNTVDLAAGPTRALWVGGAGNVDVITADGTADTIYGVQAGTLLPLSVRRVKATSTATLMSAWY